MNRLLKYGVWGDTQNSFTAVMKTRFYGLVLPTVRGYRTWEKIKLEAKRKKLESHSLDQLYPSIYLAVHLFQHGNVFHAESCLRRKG